MGSAPVVIETERLILRPHAAQDFDEYRTIRQDPAVYSFIGGTPLSDEDVWSRIMRNAGNWALLGYGVFGVFERETGRLVGETGFADFHRGLGDDFGRSPEACWAFSGAVHGRGYALEAARAAHGWIEAAFGRQRTVCLINPDNGPSLKLAGKLGYSEFGTRPYKGVASIILQKMAD